MKITKLPDKYDIKEYLKEQVLEECRYCPYCGADLRLQLLLPVCKSWFGRKDELESFSLKKLKPQKYKHWKVSCFECDNCGAEWESDPYEWC